MIEHRPLGATGLSVSRLCFGTLTISPLQRGLTPEQGADVLKYAHDAGVNFLDTAQLYGTYPHIRAANREFIVATKGYSVTAQDAEDALTEALIALNRDYIDIFLLHEQESEHTLRGHEDALNYLYKRKAAGDIRAVGISTHRVSGVLAAMKYKLDVVHPLHNIRGLGIHDGTREDMERAIHAARSAQMGVYAMKALGGGHLSGDSVTAMNYVMDNPDIDSVAVGMGDTFEVAANVAIFSGGKPAAALVRERRLMIHDWCMGCGACVKRCQSGALSLRDNATARVDNTKCILCGYCAAVCPEFCLKVI